MRELLEQFFRHYLRERNLEDTLALLTDQVISLGNGEQEVARNKEELRALMECEFKEMPQPLDYELFNYTENPLGEYGWSIFTNVLAKIDSEGVTMEMLTRLTCICVKEDGKWKIASLHMSTPTVEQEHQEFFPLRYGRNNSVRKLSSETGEKLMELVSEALPGGIMGSYLEEGYPLYTINDTMLNILGYTYEELVDATNEKMMNIIYPPDQKWVEESIEKQFHEKNEYKVEYRIVGKGGRIIWVSDIGKKIKSEDGRDAMISIMTDVSDRIERENQLIKEAQLDPLTGLYNRKRAISLIEADFLKEKSGTLYICDVDNFKSMNDTKGHLAGDRALIHLAKLIRHYADENCVTARLGGDEFMLYFTEDAEKKGADVIGKIQKEFAIAMKTSNPDLDITISAGGALRNAGEDFKDLYKKADTALYLAKKEKGQLKIYKEQ